MIRPAASAATTDRRVARELLARGVVQGVGFRPFIHRLANRSGLAGWVRNEAGSVRIHVAGPEAAIDRFIDLLRDEAPPLASIESLEVVEVRENEAEGSIGDEFRIVASPTKSHGRLPVSPDVAMCQACETELLDPKDRRYRYPFITCTDCGPRFTVIQAMPYDRERTTMSVFLQCAACLREYRDPADRRYHSETNSCPDCGPRLWFEPAEGGGAGVCDPAGADVLADPVGLAAGEIRAGRIVAIRGLGGFHLAVDATSEEAVQRLRLRKRRDAKPLAVMVGTLEEAGRISLVGPAESALLRSRERPIVLLRRREGARLAPSIAPGLAHVGVMIAYTPLHRLLLEAVGGPVVMTSGNRSDEPIATGNVEAKGRLAGVADGFLLHDREIVSRYDDSVVRIVGSHRVFLRRARGYAPLPLGLPVPATVPLVAVGPHLKNTFTLASGRSAFVSQHIGDLENVETLEHFHDAFERMRSLFRVEPTVAVRDRHPGYLSTRAAEEMAADMGFEQVIAVQHHHAHVAAVAAEWGVTREVLGIVFDGTGYGDDGCIWGAEFLVADLEGYRRRGRLRYAPLPGGDTAMRQPWRSALGYLSLERDTDAVIAATLGDVPATELALALRQIEREVNAPLASSMGRLFDAAAAVLGVCHRSGYEAEAAMRLEALAGDVQAGPLPFPFHHDAHGEETAIRILDPLPLLRALAAGRSRGVALPVLAAAFHESVAEGTARLVGRICSDEGLDTVALGGGVFQNARLLAALTARLERTGLRVLVPRHLSPNDGAISYGQAAVAAALLHP